MLTCTDMDTRTILQVISIKRIREWSSLPGKSVMLGKFPLTPPDEYVRPPQFLITKCEVSLSDSNFCKVFQNTSFYTLLWLFFFFPPSKDQQKVGITLQRGWQSERKRKIVFWFMFLWWRLTYHGNDWPYQILDSHNRPQRSHKVIIVQYINNPHTVIRSVQIAYDIRDLYSSRGTITFYLFKDP